MSILMQKLLGITYMNEADDGTGGGGGGAADDRGDALPDATAADDADDGKAAGDDKKDGDDDADDGKAADDDDKKDGEDDDQPRGKDGKFAKKDPVIPKARFDELRVKAKEREQALQTRIEQLEKAAQREVEQQDTAKIEAEVTELEEKYQKLLDEGKTAEAKDVFRQIRTKERQIVLQEAEHKSAKARDMAVEQFKFDSLVAKLETDFPVLNPDAEEYDSEKVDEVVLLRTGFERAGLSSSAALAKAVKYVLGNAPAAKTEEDEPTTKKGIGDDKKASERRSEQLKKNIETAKKQPPKLDSLGVDSNKKGGGIDGKAVGDLNEEEFEALPAATKARLRGDIIDETVGT